jgi:hypothetical protein
MGSSGEIERQRNACGQGKLRPRVYGWEQTWAAAAGAMAPGGRQRRRLLVVDRGGGAWWWWAAALAPIGASETLTKGKFFVLN